MTDYKTMINHALNSYFQDAGVSYHTLTESMRYSLLAGGKRLRPYLQHLNAFVKALYNTRHYKAKR